jgi:SPP1 family predicted phage head-tail adaptor
MNSIGKMRYRVKLESATDTTDSGGGRSQAYATKAFLYANIKPISGTETFRQGKVASDTTHELIIRYRSDIDTKYRICYGTRVFNIKSILNIDERDRFLKLSCKEGVAT